MQDDAAHRRPFMRRRAKNPAAGFALPTILITSIVMLMILLVSIGATTSVRTALNSQYYNQLAQEAAEAGVARAKDCLEQNGYSPQWGAQSLRPNTACTGGAQCSTSSCYVAQSGNVRSTFVVGTPVDQSVSQLVKSVGTVEVLRPSSSTVRATYTYTLNAKLGIDLSLNSVIFGYSGDTPSGAYFLTIAADGMLRGTGFNYDGQLGNGTYNDTLTPELVALPNNIKPVSVFTNFLSTGWGTMVIGNDNTLYAFGNNSWGQLGRGYYNGADFTPAKFNLPVGKVPRFANIQGYTNYVITTDNNVYAAGMCDYGLLGSTYTISTCSHASTPVRVALPAITSDLNTQPSDNLTSDRHTVYQRMQGGRVYAWGRNDFGQFGVGTTADSATPVKISTYGDSGQPKAVQVATDGVSVWILDDTGVIKAAGLNDYGQLGDGTTTNRSTLAAVPLPGASGKVVKIATDAYSLIAMTDTGEVWGVGANSGGQLGDGTTTNRSTAVRLILPSGVSAVDVRNTSWTNANNTYVIGDDGKVYGTGQNYYGQLGDGTTTNRSTPVAMSVINGTTIKARQIQAGYGTAVILTSNSKVYTVGNNGNGQLGDGTTTNSSTPRANRYTNILPVTSF